MPTAMKTWKVCVQSNRGAYPFVHVVTAVTSDEAAAEALAKYGAAEAAKIAWGTEPIEINPVNYAPVRHGESEAK